MSNNYCRNTRKSSKLIVVAVLFLLTLYSCGIPQTLIYLALPITQVKLATLTSEYAARQFTFDVVSKNNETLFRGYLIYYQDPSGYLNQVQFLTRDSLGNETVYDKPIPSYTTSPLIPDIPLTFTFSLSRDSYTLITDPSSGIIVTYVLLDQNGNELSDLYAAGTSIKLFVIPTGWSTSLNRLVILDIFDSGDNSLTINFS